MKSKGSWCERGVVWWGRGPEEGRNECKEETDLRGKGRRDGHLEDGHGVPGCVYERDTTPW